MAKLIRFPLDVYARLEEAARDDRRSITGMVVRLVEEALERRRQEQERRQREGQAGEC